MDDSNYGSLQDPQPSDAGLYKCTVKNAHGEVNANLTLNIESKLKLGVPIFSQSAFPSCCFKELIQQERSQFFGKFPRFEYRRSSKNEPFLAYFF